jgi:hypothetical protein
MKTRIEQGFSKLAVLVLLVLLLVVSFVVYLYSLNNNDGGQQISQQSDITPEDNSDKVEGEKYLTIEEWDIRFTLPEELRGDISYSINNNAEVDFGGPVRVDLTSKLFSEAELKCSFVESDNPRVITGFYRQNVADGVSRTNHSAFKRIGEYDFYFIKTSCEEAIDKDGSTEDKQLVDDLQAAIRDTLEGDS